MKIAIVGAPGSGKTELASKLEAWYQEENPEDSVRVLDDYVDDIGKEVDLAVGDQASYLGNLYIILRRMAKERLLSSASCRITCGTLVESSIYATMDAVRNQTELHLVRITEFMKMLGLILQDTWDYDHVFVLNLEDPDGDTFEGQVDQSIFLAVNSFGLHYVPLTGTLEEKVETATESIRQRERELEAINPNFIQGTPPPVSDE